MQAEGNSFRQAVIDAFRCRAGMSDELEILDVDVKSYGHGISVVNVKLIIQDKVAIHDTGLPGVDPAPVMTPAVGKIVPMLNGQPRVSGRQAKKSVNRVVKKNKAPLEDDLPDSVRAFKRVVKKAKSGDSGESNGGETPTTRSGRFEVTREYSTSDEDIRIMKIHLSGWRGAGKLSSEQKKHLETFYNVYASKLDESKRADLLKLFNDVRAKLGITKAA